MPDSQLESWNYDIANIFQTTTDAKENVSRHCKKILSREELLKKYHKKVACKLSKLFNSKHSSTKELAVILIFCRDIVDVEIVLLNRSYIYIDMVSSKCYFHQRIPAEDLKQYKRLKYFASAIIKKYSSHAFFSSQSKFEKHFQYLYGLCQHYGLLNFSLDVSYAHKVFSIGLITNHASSIYYQANYYEKTRGKKRNIKAKRLYKGSALLGSEKSQHRYGLILLNGEFDTAKNVREGLIYMNLAAKQANSKYPNACIDLGKIYETGIILDGSIIKDLDYAVKLYEQGGNLGSGMCYYRLAQIYRDNDQDEETEQSLKYWKKSAEMGFVESILFLANLYRDGNEKIGVEKNRDISFAWFTIGAAKGRAKAAFSIASNMEHNIFQFNSEFQIYWWYKISNELRTNQISSKRMHTAYNMLERKKKICKEKKYTSSWCCG